MAITHKTNADAGMVTLSASAGALITVLDALLVTALGWTKPYTGTNLAIYKQPVGTNERYLYVDDTNAAFARLIGLESATSITLPGSGLFPTTAQVSGGLYLDKVAGGTWRFISNGKMFYFFSTYSTSQHWFAFGDFFSYKSGDAWNTMIMGQTSAANATTQSSVIQVGSSTGTAGCFLARSYTAAGSSVNAAKCTDTTRNNSVLTMGTAPMTYPCPTDGGLHQAPCWLYEAAGPRGILPGLWIPMHTRPLTSGDTFTGAGALAGKTFIAITTGNNAGQVFVETSDTWSTY